MGTSSKKVNNLWRLLLLLLLVGITVWVDFQKEDPRTPGDSSDPVAVRGVTSGTCVNVVDGDTLDVETEDGQRIRIRLLGVDCMETHNEMKMAEQAERHGRTVKQIELIGERAKNEVRDSTLNMPVSWEIPPGTPIRDPYDRVLAYVSVNGRDLGEFLLSEGLAEARRDEHPKAGMYRSVEKPLIE